MPEPIRVKEQIRLLIQLQEHDYSIYRLVKEKDKFPAEIAGLENEFENKKATLNNLEEKAKSLVLSRKDKEIDLFSKEENIKKLSAQLSSLKTNKEYQAMLGQISGLKADKSLLEEEILKLMDEQDVFKGEIAKEKANIALEEKTLLEEKERVRVKIKEIESAVADLNAKRNRLLPQADKRILSVYERILKAKEGIAVVKVENFSCKGCHMAVTSQLVNEIKMLENIIICESCSRILYIEEDL